MVAPIGVQRAAHPDGELGTAAGVAATGALFVEAVNATTSMEDVRARHPELPFWLQLYNWNDRDALAALIARAEEAGASGIVPLVNTAIGVNHTPAARRLPAAGGRLVRALHELAGSRGRQHVGIPRVDGRAHVAADHPQGHRPR